MKTLMTVFVVLAIGPVLAVLTLIGACYGSRPLVGVMCGRNAPVTVLVGTAFWFAVIALGVHLARLRVQRQRISANSGQGRRVRSQVQRHKAGRDG